MLNDSIESYGVSDYKELEPKERFKGADVYLDASKIIKCSIEVQKKLISSSSRKKTYFERTHRAWIKYFRLLLELEPHSLTILVPCSAKNYTLYDNWRKETSHNQEPNCHYDPVAIALQAAAKTPQIEICYTSNYVENELIYRVEQSEDLRPKILVSRFPDLLRFNCSKKEQLFLSNTHVGLLTTADCSLYSVSLCQKFLDPELILQAPFEHSELKFEFSKWNRKEVYMLVVYAKSMKRLFYVVGYRWHTRAIRRPHVFINISIHLLRTFFGLLIREFLNPEDLEFKNIEISVTSGKPSKVTITPYEGEELETAVSEIASSNLPKLFEKQYKRSATKGLPSHYLTAIKEMLTDVCNGKLIPITSDTISDELGVNICMAYLRVFLVSMGLIDEILNIYDTVRVKFECTTARLRSYLLLNDDTIELI